jgi:hypothetical protein
LGIKTEVVDYVAFLISSKGFYVRRRGATTEAYIVIRRKPALAKAGEERSKATPPFGFAQDRESFDSAQGHEPVEWQMMP